MGYIYFSPEEYGLQVVAELDLSEPDYSFNKLVVWRRNSDGHFLFATDSGCSCPAPFEGYGVDDLAEFSWSAVNEIIDAAFKSYCSPDALDVAAFKDALRGWAL